MKQKHPRVVEFRLVLAAVDPPLADAWERFCGDVDFVAVHCGSILDVSGDAVVSPANSYGFIDGGIDAEYIDYFGSDVQLRVRRQIYDHHAGQLVVGAADIVETGHPSIPFLIAAPTMRVPMVLRDSAKAYLAAGSQIPRGSVSTVFRCRLPNGQRAGL